ncbi:MAG: hypothetical protein NVSMB4_12210 [Acidimicrobiales bacterium]
MSDRPRRTATQRIADILAAIDRTKLAERQLLAAETAGDSETGAVALDAVLYNLVVIGEAVASLPEDLKASRPLVPWRDVVDMRNFLAHQYFRVITSVVRDTIDAPLEQLRSACDEMGRPAPPQD